LARPVGFGEEVIFTLRSLIALRVVDRLFDARYPALHSAAGGRTFAALLTGPSPPNNAGRPPVVFHENSDPPGFQTFCPLQGWIRFVQGSPDYANVDVCVDNLAFGNHGADRCLQPRVRVVRRCRAAFFGHIVSVLSEPRAPPSAVQGVECATAPGPFFGTPAIGGDGRFRPPGQRAPHSTARADSCLWAGTGPRKSIRPSGLYVYTDPVLPSSRRWHRNAISHNAAPAFQRDNPDPLVNRLRIWFGEPDRDPGRALRRDENIVGTPPICEFGNLELAGHLATAQRAGGVLRRPRGGKRYPRPAHHHRRTGAANGQSYVVQLYAVDAAAGGLGLVGVVEQSVGYGF